MLFRSQVLELETIKTTAGVTQLAQALETNKRFNQSFEIALDNSISTPYWLLK